MAKTSSREDWDKHRQRQIRNLFLTILCLSLAVLLISVPREQTAMRFTRHSSSAAALMSVKSEFSRAAGGDDHSSAIRKDAESVVCDLSNYRTAVCRLAGDLRISGGAVTLFSSSKNDEEEAIVQKIKPYPRKWQRQLLESIGEVTIKVRSSDAGMDLREQCDVKHHQAAIVFSTGGYTGSVYHDFNDGLIPVYITSHGFHGEVVFLISEFKPWWMKKYGGIVEQLTRYPVLDFSSNETRQRVHCFPRVVVGLEIHDELAIDAAKMAYGGASMRDFQSILRAAFSNPAPAPPPPRKNRRPKLVLITRRRTRVITNEADLLNLARNLGFEVEALEPGFHLPMAKMYQTLQSADALIGVHGAALTHLLFMRPSSILLQIVPLGTQSPALSFYGNPAMKAGLQYMEYRIQAQESSLLQQYGTNHSVILHPPENPGKSSSWTDMKEIYLDQQNVAISLPRFEPVLREVFARITARRDHLRSVG